MVLHIVKESPAENDAFKIRLDEVSDNPLNLARILILADNGKMLETDQILKLIDAALKKIREMSTREGVIDDDDQIFYITELIDKVNHVRDNEINRRERKKTDREDFAIEILLKKLKNMKETVDNEIKNKIELKEDVDFVKTRKKILKEDISSIEKREMNQKEEQQKQQRRKEIENRVLTEADNLVKRNPSSKPAKDLLFQLKELRKAKKLVNLENAAKAALSAYDESPLNRNKVEKRDAYIKGIIKLLPKETGKGEETREEIIKAITDSEFFKRNPVKEKKLNFNFSRVASRAKKAVLKRIEPSVSKNPKHNK